MALYVLLGYRGLQPGFWGTWAPLAFVTRPSQNQTFNLSLHVLLEQRGIGESVLTGWFQPKRSAVYLKHFGKVKPNSSLNDSMCCRVLTMVTFFLVAVPPGRTLFLPLSKVDC